VLLLQSRSQQVSVLGAVQHPGRYVIEANAPVWTCWRWPAASRERARVVYLLRPGGRQARAHRAGLSTASSARRAAARATLHGGDSVFVPQADQFYVYGEVQAPNMYRLEPGMTVEQALSRSGGVTARGSRKRIEIAPRRRRLRDARGRAGRARARRRRDPRERSGSSDERRCSRASPSRAAARAGRGMPPDYGAAGITWPRSARSRGPGGASRC
jgi:protein involved in polysaccharide export with SLBB domain